MFDSTSFFFFISKGKMKRVTLKKWNVIPKVSTNLISLSMFLQAINQMLKTLSFSKSGETCPVFLIPHICSSTKSLTTLYKYQSEPHKPLKFFRCPPFAGQGPLSQNIWNVRWSELIVLDHFRLKMLLGSRDQVILLFLPQLGSSGIMSR